MTMTTGVVFADDATQAGAAIAGFLAGYCGSTRRSYAIDLRLFAASPYCARPSRGERSGAHVLTQLPPRPALDLQSGRPGWARHGLDAGPDPTTATALVRRGPALTGALIDPRSTLAQLDRPIAPGRQWTWSTTLRR